MNEVQETKAKKICKLWEDYEECCRTISGLNVFLKNKCSIVISQPYNGMATANIDFETKTALLTGAMDELNHLRETIEVKISNELGESCK